jgi:hypothetical protein
MEQILLLHDNARPVTCLQRPEGCTLRTRVADDDQQGDRKEEGTKRRPRRGMEVQFSPVQISALDGSQCQI